jgi:radical SAM superfamily enzyme YgiQ (UPF0313 family)
VKKRFKLIMIKPSHYDDDGYVIQWYKSSVPSNTMATIYGLGLNCVKNKVLGEDVDIELSSYDETNTRIKVKNLARAISGSGGYGLVALVGVQSNQFPRAVDLARQFRKENIQVAIGGFHVSGCLAMLKEMPPDLEEAMDLGISLFAGEIEGRMEELLQDAMHKKLKSIYNFLDVLPDLGNQPVPFLPVEYIQRMTGMRTAFDAGRGCPFECSFCTIINVQGRKSRYRDADDVERIIRTNVSQGVFSFFITDDNFSRNRNWEVILDRIIRMREENGFNLTFTIQVDTVCHKIPRFIEKAGRAGVSKVFIGLETINSESLKGVGKKQNNITDYRILLQSMHKVGILTFAGYILGFPGDTPEKIIKDIGIIQRELPVDLLEFFILTPLPGSRDHKNFVEQGIPLDTDMNNYDITHVTAPHDTMSAEQLLEIYNRAWEIYYSPDHVERILRRASEWGFKVEKMMWMLLEFYACATIEKVHPLEGGIFRRKYRRDRRHGLPRENPITFYSRYLWESLTKPYRFFWIYKSYKKILKRVMENKSEEREVDVAMEPVSVSEQKDLDLI